MEKWIYFDSDKITDIVYLSIALDCSKEKYNIVRTTTTTQFLLQHPNVKEVGFPKPEDNVLTITRCNNESTIYNVNYILDIIGEARINSIPEFHLHVKTEHPLIIERVNKEKYALLMLSECNCEQPVDLFFIDDLCHLLQVKGIKIASLGDFSIPCIRGTADLRNLLCRPELSEAIRHSPFVITNQKEIAEFCRVTNTPAYYIEQRESGFLCNTIEIQTPNHLLNLILKQYLNE